MLNLNRIKESNENKHIPKEIEETRNLITESFKDLEFVMEKYKLNKVDAIVKAIKMLKDYKPKRYKVIKDNDNEPTYVTGITISTDKPKKSKTIVQKISL